MAEGAQMNAEALLLNDEVVDMLMLLDYETGFCTKEFKPLNRTFFSYPAPNPAYQFKYFVAVVMWAMGLANLKIEWDEYDDPGTVVANMLGIVKDAGIQVSVTVPKVKQGYGDAVCNVLHALLKDVLRRRQFEWGVPSYPDEGLADEAEVDSDAEVGSVAEDEMPGEGEEDDLMYQEEEVKKPSGDSDDEDHQVLQATVDPAVWLLEIERVAPKLKIQLQNDSQEWRTHLQQTRSFKQVIETQFPPAQTQLQKLQSGLGSALDKIRSKEAFINTQFEQRALDHRTQQTELVQVQAQNTELNEVVMNRQMELKTIADELEVVKADMEERSSTATDTAPIVKMKDAFKRLRADTRQLEVRIGVVSHTLMQSKLTQRPQEGKLKHGVYAGPPGGNASDDDMPRSP